VAKGYLHKCGFRHFKCVLQINLEPIPLQECMPPSFSNSLLFIVMKLGQRVVQDPHIDYRVILNLWALLSCRWASKLAPLHGNIVTHPQMPHQVVFGRIKCITPINTTSKFEPIFWPMHNFYGNRKRGNHN
jgi:hypothetical protein